MPSTRKQYNAVFDVDTEEVLRKVAFNNRKSVTEMLRYIVARDAEIKAEAEVMGLSLHPETVGWGGRREAKKQTEPG